MAANQATVSPWLRDIWTNSGKRQEGTWGEVFGEDDGDGGRAFGTWSYARFADQVAAAGKSVLNLPMYINSWQGESPCFQRYMDVCHVAAPHLDFMGPDLYLEKGFGREVELALRPWNNVAVPETSSSSASGARAWTAYGKYGCLYFGSYLGPEIETSRCGKRSPSSLRSRRWSANERRRPKCWAFTRRWRRRARRGRSRSADSDSVSPPPTQ